MKYDEKDVIEFLIESNFIENERSDEAHQDAQKAWLYCMQIKEMTLESVKMIHQLLMQRLRPDIAGKWRECDVWIGGIHKQFISTEIIDAQIEEFCRNVNTDVALLTDEEKELHTQRLHVDFERIHPFEDGNGRVGRIIYNWHRLQVDLPIHIIHEGNEQMDYYKWFKNEIV